MNSRPKAGSVGDKPRGRTTDHRHRDLPEAYSINRSCGYFPPPPAGHDTVLYVGGDADGLRPFVADVRTVGDIGDDLDIYLLTGLRQLTVS